MKKKQIICGIFGLIALHTTSYADQSDVGCCQPEMIAGDPVVCGQFGPIYPQEADIATACSCMDMYVTADLIYWSSYTFSSVVGFRNTINGGTEELMQRDSYKPGFKVAVGADIGMVILDLQYIWWHHQYKSNYSAGAGESVFPFTASQFLGLVAIPNFAQLRSTWKTHYDQLYFTMQKPVYVGTNLIVNATVGVLTQWFKQETVINGIGQIGAPGINGFVSGNHRYWSIGPAVGIKGKLLFCWGLSLLGNFDLALSYQHFTKGFDVLSFPPVNPLNPFANSTETYKFSKRFKGVGMTAAGIGWESYFCCNRYHANVALFYDMITNLGNTVNFEHFLITDVYFHGWTLEARFDF
ncbi:MAG: hypothetical protein JSS30_08225 [Verrucomicrobia bacterium]|nr:hypothetical protein [Verrucomicrobiota bacterium]